MATVSAVKLCYECIHAEMKITDIDGEEIMISTGVCRALGFKHASEVYDTTLCRFAYAQYDYSKIKCDCDHCDTEDKEDEI